MMTMTMMTMIGENQDDELKDEDSPLIELLSVPHHGFRLPDFHKPNQKPFFIIIFTNLTNMFTLFANCQVFANLTNIFKFFGILILILWAMDA